MSDTEGGGMADDEYTTEPVGGGAESVPDPTAPGTPGHEMDDRPAGDPEDPGAEPSSEPPVEPNPMPDDMEMGGEGTIEANDELQGGADR
ncbi:MAG: hypothetical protein JWP85_2056 [Rhodoglobus sp.]|nr:hypothetical protein [Rhodoglobus sp.]